MSIFKDIAEYGNKAWNGSYTPDEVSENARIYAETFLNNPQDAIILDLICLLRDDGDARCLAWAEKLEKGEV